MAVNRNFTKKRDQAQKDRTLVRYEEMTRSRRSWPWWRLLLTGMSALAMALSVSLSWHYLVGGSVIGCGGRSPCDKVLNSRWSAVAGVLPVGGLAAGVYLAILIAGLFIGPADLISILHNGLCRAHTQPQRFSISGHQGQVIQLSSHFHIPQQLWQLCAGCNR